MSLGINYDVHRVLGVNVVDISMPNTIDLLSSILCHPDGRSRSVFFVNAHTLNLACEDQSYRHVLNRASYVFGDGTGVRWATRLLCGATLKDNVNGTDLIPTLLQSNAGRDYGCYLLGHSDEGIARSAEFFKRTWPGWKLVGYHHGYLKPEDDARVVDEINQVRPHLLLVGMGNPLQERWINDHISRLEAALCIGVGGLFTYWSGDLARAPEWIRQAGHEWLHLLTRQPHKFERYVYGNPKFLARVAATRLGLFEAFE